MQTNKHSFLGSKVLLSFNFFFYENETYTEEKVTLINDILTEAAFL